MVPYYDKDGITIFCGDCRKVIPHIGIVDAVVTDPPYGLGFMGKTWDSTVPPVELWMAVLNALKPGGHLLSFAGTRTHHRMAVNIEDAGFEIRDMIAWVYGSGFPKSMDVSKAIDKAAGAEREVVGQHKFAARRPNIKRGRGENVCTEGGDLGTPTLTAPSTDAAKQWDGWGTALKPALEPITLARRPLIGTVVQNVLEHRTGALNIDGCRIEAFGRPLREIDPKQTNSVVYEGRVGGGTGFDGGSKAIGTTDHGRWPANLIHDGSEEVVEQFPETTSGANPTRRSSAKFKNAYSEFAGQESCEQHRGADAGNASRFFYCAKASSEDRGPGNNHPTVKPVALMRWLVRLVTCETSVVLDPFAGSGTTLVAAKLEGRRAIGIEMDENYAKIAVDRLKEIPRTLF
jgi:DNA modification methylase